MGVDQFGALVSQSYHLNSSSINIIGVTTAHVKPDSTSKPIPVILYLLK